MATQMTSTCRDILVGEILKIEKICNNLLKKIVLKFKGQDVASNYQHLTK